MPHTKGHVVAGSNLWLLSRTKSACSANVRTQLRAALKPRSQLPENRQNLKSWRNFIILRLLSPNRLSSPPQEGFLNKELWWDFRLNFWLGRWGWWHFPDYVITFDAQFQETNLSCVAANKLIELLPFCTWYAVWFELIVMSSIQLNSIAVVIGKIFYCDGFIQHLNCTNKTLLHREN